MTRRPDSVKAFLSGKHAANAIYRKLRACGYDVVPVNPTAVHVEGAACYSDVRSVPGALHGVLIATHPSFGRGSVAEDAVRECPLMYCEPVDVAHRCMRWWLGRSGRVPI